MHLEGPPTGHLDTGFLWFSCLQANAEMVIKFQVATAFFSWSPHNFNSSLLNPFAVKPNILSKKKRHACCLLYIEGQG
jgi:hypothetical protein